MRIKLTILFTFLFFLVQSQTYLQPEYDNLATKLNFTFGDAIGADTVKGNTGTVVYFRYNNDWNFFNPTDSVIIQASQTNLMGFDPGVKGIGILQSQDNDIHNFIHISKDNLLAGGKGVALYRYEGGVFGGDFAAVAAKRSNSLGLEADMQVSTAFGLNEIVIADSFFTVSIQNESAGIGIENI